MEEIGGVWVVVATGECKYDQTRTRLPTTLPSASGVGKADLHTTLLWRIVQFFFFISGPIQTEREGETKYRLPRTTAEPHGAAVRSGVQGGEKSLGGERKL